MNITFSTYDLLAILKSKGFEEQQALGVVEAIKHSHINLATKQDLLTLEHRITIRVGSMLVAMTGVLIAVLKFWH